MRSIVILDNFSSHHATDVRQAAKANDIELVFLPPYSPNLNPIEFIWKSIKRVVSVNFISSLDDLRILIGTSFMEFSQHASYATAWIPKFAPQVLSYEELCE